MRTEKSNVQNAMCECNRNSIKKMYSLATHRLYSTSSNNNNFCSLCGCRWEVRTLNSLIVVFHTFKIDVQS